MRRGVAVTVVDQAAQPMTTLDPDMGAAVHRAMEGIGIDVRTGTAVTGFETGSDHRIRSVLTADGSIPADVVVLGLGVRPNTALAREAGLPLGDHGGLRTNVQMQVLGHDHIWAGGDCVEVLNLVSGQYQHVPLGTHANKQGRVIGHNLAGSYATFPGVVGTAVSKVCHLEIARTGLRERDATRAGFEYVTVTVRSGTKAGYFPGTQQMTVKMTAERLHRTPAGRADRRLRGIGQADRHGRDGAVEPDDGRRDDRPGPRLRSAVRAGLGSDPRGGAAGRRRRAPRGRRPAMTRLSFAR